MISCNGRLRPLIPVDEVEFVTVPVAIDNPLADADLFFELMTAIGLEALLLSVVPVLLLQHFVAAGLRVGGVEGRGRGRRPCRR